MSEIKVTIITSIFNNKKFIGDAINSVNNQTYNNIEHIIVDGNSTDGSKEIIKNNMNKKIIFVVKMIKVYTMHLIKELRCHLVI